MTIPVPPLSPFPGRGAAPEDYIAQADTTMQQLPGVFAWMADLKDSFNLGAGVLSAGYLPPVPYAAGIKMTLALQTVQLGYVTYAPILEALPFTTSGEFEEAKFRVIQGVTGAALAAAIGASLVGCSNGRTVQQQLDMLYYGVVNVWDPKYGADPTGQIECAGAIQSALDDSPFVNFGSGTYKIAAPLIPGSGHVLHFSGATFRTVGRSTSAWYFNGIHGWSMVGRFNVIGPVTGIPTYEADGGHGIIVRDCYDWVIENPHVSWFAGSGLFITVNGEWDQRGPGVSLGQVLHGNFQKNGYGVRTSGGFMAEYVAITGTFAEYNANAGYSGYAGNLMWNGGSISHNYLNGVEVLNSFNSAHGAFNGVSINHNVQAAIIALGVVNGQLFNCCPIFDNNGGPRVGAIFLNESSGVTFNGCELYVDFVVNNVSKDKINHVNGAVFASGGGPPGRQYHVYSDDASEFTLVFSPDCYQAGSLGNGVPNTGLSASDCQMTAAMDQPLTPAAETRITWNSFVSRHGRNLHDGSLRNFKIAAPGVYRINCYLALQSAAAEMPASGIYCVLKINGAPKRYHAIPPHGANSAWANIPFTIQLASGDVVDLYVISPSGAVQVAAASEISISCG